MARDRSASAVTRRKDGQDWVIGTDADVAWIQQETTPGLTIGAAIPPIFPAYGTIVVPDKHEGRAAETQLLLDVLGEHSGDQPWWLGYLDTGVDDVVFADAPFASLYESWRYVLVLASKQKAEQWRVDLDSWRAPGPDLIFPADHSWLVSWLWDDDWRCLGGPAGLVDRLHAVLGLQVRGVTFSDDATPPGHTAR